MENKWFKNESSSKNIELFSGKLFLSILQNIAGPNYPFIMWPSLNISKTE